MTEYSFIKCKTALSTSKLPGLKYTLNPYVGCEHGCLYCYSPAVLRDAKMLERWGKVVRAKENIIEVLREEVERKKKGTVGVSTVSDPYQPLEKRLELTLRCMGLLSAKGFDVSIHTKSDLVLRDSFLINPPGFDVGVTITTMDKNIARRLEPMASPPDARASVLDHFSSKRIETWIFLGPIIPEINDSEESITEVVKVAKSNNSHIIYDKLNLRAGVLDRLEPLLEFEKPGLTGRISELTGPKSTWWKKVRSKVEKACKDHYVKCEPAFPDLSFS
jgi:DNA repair photolyase